MISCSRLVLGFLNVLALAFSISQIIYALMNDHHSMNEQCYKNSASRLILMISYFLLIMSLIGLVASCCKSNRALQLTYLVAVVISTIVAMAASVFIFAVLPKGSANATWQKAQNGNWIKEFSPLMRKALVNDEKWIVIRTCLVDYGVCEGFRNHSTKPAWKENLHYLELGCCIPPRRCGYVQKNETLWEIPESGIVSEDTECKTWGKSKDGKCYDCDSCKAGYLSEFQRDWRADNGIYIGIVAILIIATSLSCYSSRQERADEGTKGYERNVV